MGLVLLAAGVATSALALGPVPALADSQRVAPQAVDASNEPEPIAEPSQAYLDSQAHQYDEVEFTPGDAVTVPFRPRAGDTWTVGGEAPTALPAGRISGFEILGLDEPATATGTTAVTEPAAAGPVALPAAKTPALKRQVLGFLPWWKLGSASTVLNYDVLSTIAYFGVAVHTDGTLDKTDSDGSTSREWAGWTSSDMTTVIDAAHAKGTRVVLSVTSFAWDSSGIAMQKALLTNATSRANLAHNIAVEVRDRGVDGVNLDFEPICADCKPGFISFLRSLRAELDAVAPGYELTVCTTGYPSSYELEKIVAAGAADAVWIMGYSYRQEDANPVGSHSPLSSPITYDLKDTIKRYLARIPASKVMLGLPWYGRVWSTGTVKTLHGPNMSGPTYGTVANPTYAQSKELAAENGRQYDTVEDAAWTAYYGYYGGTSPTWRQLYYDDAQSLNARYDYINRVNLRGSGIWCLGNDGYVSSGVVHRYPDLWQPIADNFINDTTPPLAGIVNMAPIQDHDAIDVGWTARDDWTSIKRYDVQVSTDGGAWTAWLTGTNLTSAAYMGASGHGYAFRVRATDAAGNVGTWNSSSVYSATPALATGGFGQVVATTLNVRELPGTNKTIVGTLAAGNLVAIIDGPVSADANTWYRIVGPLAEWGSVGSTFDGNWVSAGDASNTYMIAAPAPNATFVQSNLTGLSFSGTASATPGPHTATPIPGAPGTAVTISWTSLADAEAVSAIIHKDDGSIVATIDLGAQTAGSHSYVWDGAADGVTQPSGSYVIQIQATIGGQTWYLPAPAPFSAGVMSAGGIQVEANGRWSGTSRFATAAAISRNTFASGVPIAFIATGLNYPDALAGAGASGKLGGPILLVSPASIPTATATELTRLHPARIVVLGGTGAVSASVATTLKKYTVGTVERWYGRDRFATAAAISRNTFSPGVPVAFVATGLNYPDALAGAASAGKLGGPILLVSTTSIPKATATELTRLAPARIVVLGSTSVVSASVATNLQKYTAGAVERWSGPNRFATAAAISSHTFDPGVPVVFIATGFNYPDALAGAGASGKLGGPILLVTSTAIPAETATELTRLAPARIVVLGGTSAVSESVRIGLAEYAAGS
jgi:spore germination protein YaaH/putative cell wall-binding protein